LSVESLNRAINSPAGMVLEFIETFVAAPGAAQVNRPAHQPAAHLLLDVLIKFSCKRLPGHPGLPYQVLDRCLFGRCEQAASPKCSAADPATRTPGSPATMLAITTVGPVALPPVDGETFAPVSNLADHYRWVLGQRANDGVSIFGSPVYGAAVSAGFWLSESVAAPSGDFLVADIPAHAVP
jgi:hypothetical protein